MRDNSFKYVQQRKAEQYDELRKLILDIGIDLVHHVNGGSNLIASDWIEAIKDIGFEKEIEEAEKE